MAAAVLNSFLPFFIPLLPTSAPIHLHLALTQLLPALLEKANDPKERVHTSASGSIVALGRKCYDAEPGSHAAGSIGTGAKGKEKESLVGYWERQIKETMAGKGWRAKVECIRLLLTMRSEAKASLPLKPWLAPLVDLLEDGDSHVRDQAREVSLARLDLVFHLIAGCGHTPISTVDSTSGEVRAQETARTA